MVDGVGRDVSMYVANDSRHACRFVRIGTNASVSLVENALPTTFGYFGNFRLM